MTTAAQPIRTRHLVRAVSATLLFAAAAASADDVSELRERLEAQEQKIRVLERKLELHGRGHEGGGAQHASRARVAATGLPHPVRGWANVVRLRGVLHFDGRYFTGRHHARDRGHVDLPPRAADARRHAQRHLRLSASRRISPAAARSSSTRSSPRGSSHGQSSRPANSRCRSVWSDSSRRPTCASSSARCPPAWCRIATSACSSAAISPAGS